MQADITHQNALSSRTGFAIVARLISTQTMAVALLALTNAVAGVGDPTIRTSHPTYAGEGAFQSIDDCVRFATHDATSEQEKALALYSWMLTHQWHLMSPQEWCVPGRTPDTRITGDYEMVVFDANRARFSYGYGLCGTVHSWNEPYWKSLGMNARRRAFPGHVNSEVFYADSWHAFDTDMAGLLFRRDGVVAGYDDIIRDPTLAESVKPPIPHYPFAWPQDFNTMKRGWQEVAQGGSWFKLYNSGYAAHPGIVHVRSGESFTRWYDRDHFGGPSKRRFWHHQDGGPYRNWAFFDQGAPTHTGDNANCRAAASYCNGEFDYVPQLATAAYREGVSDQSKNTGSRAESPRLYSTDGQPAFVTFRHFSPYVICGDPVDDANPMSGPATDGLVLEATPIGSVRMEFSADEGQTWHAVKVPTRTSAMPVRIDLTDLAKGRYGWQIRFHFSGDAGLDALRFVTTTQVCQAMYPRLKPNGTRIEYAAKSRAVVAVLPDFGLPPSQVDAFEVTDLRATNVAYKGRSESSRRAYETTDNQPGTVVFRVASPEPLQQVRAAVRYQLRVPPPKNTDYHLEISTDRGMNWRTFATAQIPGDNEYSSGWLSGTAEIDAADITEAMVKVHFHADGHRTGIIEAQFYGVHEVPGPQAVTLEYGWLTGGQLQTHTQKIPAGTTSHEFDIETTQDIADQFVRITAD